MREKTPMTISAKDEAKLVAAPRTFEAGPHEGLKHDRDHESRVLTRISAPVPEESLVIDDRSVLSPAQMVENKLVSLLQGATLPVSHLQMRGLLRGRRGV